MFVFLWWLNEVTENRVVPQHWTKCKLNIFLWHFLASYSSALLAIMSVEKCYALYFPLKAKTVCTVKTAKWMCSISAILYFAYNFPLVVFSSTVESDGHVMCWVRQDYWVVHRHIIASLHSFLPFTVMFIMNSAIIVKFIKAKMANHVALATQSTNQALSKTATRGTVMLVTVCVTFMVLTSLMAVATYMNRRFHPFVQLLVFILPTFINHSINGVLYCIVGTRFRKELLNVLCYCNKRKKHLYFVSFSKRLTKSTTKTSLSAKSSSKSGPGGSPTGTDLGLEHYQKLFSQQRFRRIVFEIFNVKLLKLLIMYLLEILLNVFKHRCYLRLINLKYSGVS